MILRAFCFYDSKAQCFYTPFFLHYPGQAMRVAIDTAGDMNTTLSRYPEDFHLYQIGEWDDHTAALTPHAPISLGSVASFISKPKPGFTDEEQR